MNLLRRVKGLILSPNAEWAVIENEKLSVAELYLRYIVVLAAIPPFATFFGVWLFGYSRGILGEAHMTFVGGATRAIAQYLVSLPMIFIVAFVLSSAAPSFDGRSNDAKALALAAYSYTPAWLAEIFGLVPGFRWLDILGFYGVYLFYLGAPRMLKCPKDNADVLTLIALIASIAAGALHAFIVRLIAPAQSALV
jgi:hypothetical protein